ncbi:MAG: hypothetical protein ABI665_03780 [Vicinamibacterales bacterium]
MSRITYSPWATATTIGVVTIAAPVAVSTWAVGAAIVIAAIVVSAPAAVSAWTIPSATVRLEVVPSVPIEPFPYVEVELDGYGNGWTDVTGDCEQAFGITIRHGIQSGGPADLVAPTGTAKFVLDNSDHNEAELLGYYSPYHANKRIGWGLGIGCRIRFKDPSTGLFYARFLGRIDAIDPSPGVDGPRLVAVTATDWMDEAARFKLSTSIGEQVGKRWDEILGAILAEMPRQPLAAALDTGAETYPYALDTSSVTNQTALGEFVKLAASEFGLIYVKADGTFRAEGRHTRLLRTTYDWVLDDTELQALSMPSTRAEVINTVRVTIHPKVVDAAATTIVYDQASVITLVAGETKFLLGSFRDPVTGDPIGATDVVVPPVAGTDYIANTLPDGTGTNQTALVTVTVEVGQSGANFSITNNHSADVSLTRNQLRGRGIYDRGSQTFAAPADAVSAESIITIGEHAVEFDMPYQANDDVGRGAALYLRNKYSSAFPQARTIVVFADTADALTQMLARDISDRLTISETVTGLSNGYFINGIELQYLPSGHLQASYILAPAQDPFAGLYWILGTNVLGAG